MVICDEEWIRFSNGEKSRAVEESLDLPSGPVGPLDHIFIGLHGLGRFSSSEQKE